MTHPIAQQMPGPKKDLLMSKGGKVVRNLEAVDLDAIFARKGKTDSSGAVSITSPKTTALPIIPCTITSTKSSTKAALKKAKLARKQKTEEREVADTVQVIEFSDPKIAPFSSSSSTTSSMSKKRKTNAQGENKLDDDHFADSRGVRSTIQRTEDGLPIYSDKSLKIGQGDGDTPDCPFDCWCCY